MKTKIKNNIKLGTTFLMCLVLGTFSGLSQKLDDKTIHAGGKDQVDKHINESVWNWTVDDDNDGGHSPVFEGYRWWQNGGNKFGDLMAYLKDSYGERSFIVYNSSGGFDSPKLHTLKDLESAFISQVNNTKLYNEEFYNAGLALYSNFTQYGSVDQGYDWLLGSHYRKNPYYPGDVVAGEKFLGDRYTHDFFIAGSKRTGGKDLRHLKDLTKYFVIMGMGNVGIDEEDPTERLHVNGNVNVTGFARTKHLVSYSNLLIAANSEAKIKGANIIFGFGGSHFNFNDKNSGIKDGYSGIYYPTDARSYANEKMRLTAEGRLGIGTTSPEVLLHVNGDIKAKNMTLDEQLGVKSLAIISDKKATATDNTDVEILRLERPNDPNVKWRNSAIFKLGSYSTDIAAKTKLSLYGNHDSDSNDNDLMMTWLSNGRVGIGTSDPEFGLHLKERGLLVENNGIKVSVTSNKNNTYGWMGTTSEHPLVIGTSNNAINIRLDLDDNVFIGYEDKLAYVPERKAFNVKQELLDNFDLFVDNGILSEDYALAPKSEWADHVFKKDYNLMPLSEVSNFIQKNGHLPKMPNQAEINKNGYNLHDQNVRLLEKIEELTLYIIKQNRDLKLLEERLSRLEKK